MNKHIKLSLLWLYQRIPHQIQIKYPTTPTMTTKASKVATCTDRTLALTFLVGGLNPHALPNQESQGISQKFTLKGNLRQIIQSTPLIMPQYPYHIPIEHSQARISTTNSCVTYSDRPLALAFLVGGLIHTPYRTSATSAQAKRLV